MEKIIVSGALAAGAILAGGVAHKVKKHIKAKKIKKLDRHADVVYCEAVIL